jgi:anti-sigma B factor antagonist
MAISTQDLDGGVTKVVISGRIDVAGAKALDMPLAVIAGSRRSVIIDLSGVEFLASLGMRGLVVSAKSIISKKGKVVLLSPVPSVEETLTVAGITELLPIHRDEAAAIAAVTLTQA